MIQQSRHHQSSRIAFENCKNKNLKSTALHRQPRSTAPFWKTIAPTPALRRFTAKSFSVSTNRMLSAASSVWWIGADGADGNEQNRKGFLTAMSQLHANLLKLLLTKKHLKISALKARKLRESLKKLHEDAAGQGQESQSYFGVPLHLQQQVKHFCHAFAGRNKQNSLYFASFAVLNCSQSST